MSSEKILVVEDNAMFARMINVDLSKEGYDVQVVQTGAEFLNLADRQSHDLLIIDLTCNEMRLDDARSLQPGLEPALSKALSTLDKAVSASAGI